MFTSLLLVETCCVNPATVTNKLKALFLLYAAEKHHDLKVQWLLQNLYYAIAVSSYSQTRSGYSIYFTLDFYIMPHTHTRTNRTL